MKDLRSDQVLYEDNHLLVVDKPAGVATMGAELGLPTVAKAAAAYLKRTYGKPGNAFVGVVSRLDQRVSGVLVLAKTSKAASRLSEQIRNRTWQKRYLAWVFGDRQLLDENQILSTPPAADDSSWSELRHWMRKDEQRQRMQVLDQPQSSDDKGLAILRCRTLCSAGANHLLEIDLITGRKHQIRAQLGHLGLPVVGDRKYASTRTFPDNQIALHCWHVTVQHPTLKSPNQFLSDVQKHWPRLPTAFQQAIDSAQPTAS